MGASSHGTTTSIWECRAQTTTVSSPRRRRFWVRNTSCRLPRRTRIRRRCSARCGCAVRASRRRRPSKQALTRESLSTFCPMTPFRPTRRRRQSSVATAASGKACRIFPMRRASSCPTREHSARSSVRLAAQRTSQPAASIPPKRSCRASTKLLPAETILHLPRTTSLSWRMRPMSPMRAR